MLVPKLRKLVVNPNSGGVPDANEAMDAYGSNILHNVAANTDGG
jgi:hypothetical protein